RYEIVKGTNNSLIKKRSFPKSFKIKKGTFHQISFDQYGRIPKGGHFDIETPYTKYRVIFPFGKGRGYIIEVYWLYIVRSSFSCLNTLHCYKHRLAKDCTFTSSSINYTRS